MSIYIGNDLEDRLKALETENASLRKYNEYHQLVHEIDHMSDLHIDSSFYKQSLDIDKYFKIKKWHDSSIGQSTVIQQLNNKRPNMTGFLSLCSSFPRAKFPQEVYCTTESWGNTHKRSVCL